MEPESAVTREQPSIKKAFTPTLRDSLMIVFRRWRIVVVSFFTILPLVFLYALLKPKKYTAEMKILVKRERVDPLVTAETNSSPRSGAEVPEQELNSEVQLLMSRDLIEKVVVAAGLDKVAEKPPWWSKLLSFGTPQKNAAPTPDMIVAKLSTLTDSVLGQLDVEPMKKTNLISIQFVGTDPKEAAHILKTLQGLYLEKHLAVHRPAGAFEFFQQETERYRNGLKLIETRLSHFGQQQGGSVSPQIEKDNTLKKLSEFEGKLQDTQAGIAETKERVAILEKQLASTSSRMTTAIRTMSNRAVVDQLKSTLMNLELKRLDLLGKYEPGYRLVEDMDRQIAQARAALAEEEKISLSEESTDRNPIFQMLTQDLAKAKSDLASLTARFKATVETVVQYREEARRLDQKDLAQRDLVRAQKIAQENYELYLKKQEEVRISNALDRQRIVNVAVMEEATVPTTPSAPRRSIIVLAGGVLAAWGA